MIPAGFMYKEPIFAPAWVGAPEGARLHSLSGCISHYFTDYIRYWQHNGFWLFDSPEVLDQVAAKAQTNASHFDLLYFEVAETQFDEARSSWLPVTPDPSFPTSVRRPSHSTLLGHDIVCFSGGTSPECSPITCCGLGSTVALNQAALLETEARAREALESGLCNETEPGPFRIVSVSLVRLGDPPAA